MKRAALIALLLLAGCGDGERAADPTPGSTLAAHARRPRRRRLPRDRSRRAAGRPRARAPSSARRSSPSASSRTPTSATRSRPRGCRSWTGSAHRSPPPSARRRRSPPRRWTPPSERSTARSRTRCSSPATSPTTRSATSSQLATRILKGGEADPDSGATGYRGVQQADQADPFYYRPDHDAPTHPGALAQAQRPFTAEGLKSPFYELLGNHDVLVQGEVPPTPEPERDRHRRPARGGVRPRPARPARATRPRRRRSSTTSRSSTASRSRPTPTARSSPRSRAHPGTVDLGPNVEAILVDTVNRAGTSQAAHHARRARPPRQRSSTPTRWVVVFSHNQLTPEALNLLDQHPNVVAAISGNTHKNRIRAAQPLLADQHEQPRRLSPAIAHVPPQADRPGRRPGDLDGRPRRAPASRASRESSPTSTPRAVGPSTLRVLTQDRNARLFVTRNT